MVTATGRRDDAAQTLPDVSLDGTRRWHGEGVRIVDVARRLRELRSGGDSDVHSTLTRVMNLVVWAPDAPSATDVEALADALSSHHPSRAVIVRPAGGGDGIDARVEVMSRPDRPGGRALQVEQIVLTLHGAVASHAGSAVIPLLRSELPTFLWWPGAPDPASPQFSDLAAVADRIVTETGRDMRGEAAVARLAAVVASVDAPVTDLAWAAISPWRQLIATSLRGDTLLRLRAGAARATITGPAGEPPLEASLLAGWLDNVLGPALATSVTAGAGDAAVQGVRLDADGACLLDLARDGATATVTLRTAAGGPRCLSLPHPDRGSLLAGELELRGRDRSFEEAVAAASRLGG